MNNRAFSQRRRCSVLVLAGLAALGTAAHPLAAQQAMSSTARGTVIADGVIAGRVTFPDGKPAPGLRVSARSTAYVGPAPAATAVTDAQGRYVLHVDTQAAPRLFAPDDAPADRTYTVAVSPDPTRYVLPADRTVTVPGESTQTVSGMDFVVTTGPQITVHIHNGVTGAPVAGIAVTSQTYSGGSSDPKPVGSTDAQGKVTFRSHALMFHLQISVTGPLQPAPGEALYKDFALKPSEDTVWDVPLYPPAPTATAPDLTRPGTPASTVWRGVLLGPNGKPVPDTLVTLECDNGNYGGRAVTDDAGRFAFPTTQPWQFSRPWTLQDYHSREFLLLADTGDAHAAVFPTLEELLGTMTLRLTRTPTAALTGRVTDAAGVPLAGVPVRGTGTFPAPSVNGYPEYGPGISASGVTDAQGRFTLAGLLPGTAWRLDFGGQPQGNAGGVWAYGATQYPPLPPAPAPRAWPTVAVGPGDRHDIGTVIVPHALEVVTGRVLGPGGVPVAADLAVVITGDGLRSAVTPAPDGTFRLEHLVREPLTLSVYRTDHGGYRGDGPTSPNFVLQQPVRAGDTNVQIAIPAQPAPTPPVAAPPPPPKPTGPAFSYDFSLMPNLALVAPAKPHGPIQDEAAAIRAAHLFLDRIGEPSGVAVAPDEWSDLNLFPGGWTLLSSVSPQFHMALDRATGSVVRVLDQGPSAAFGPVSSPEPGTLTQAQATQRGALILRAAGLPLGYASLSGFHQGHAWVLFWLAQYRGIPFPAGGYPQLSVDDRTGRLLELRIWDLQPPPVTDEENIHRAQALARADAVFASVALPSGIGVTAFKQVVLPNAAWGAPAPAPDTWRTQPGRVAWIVQRTRAAPDTPMKIVPIAEVWIDAQTGAILGGVPPAPATP